MAKRKAPELPGDDVLPWRPRGGRPPRRYTSEELAAVRRLAEIGAPQHVIAAALGITPEWFSKRQRKDKQLRAALAAGIARGDGTILETLFDEAIRKRNTAALLFLARNRLGYSNVWARDGEENRDGKRSGSKPEKGPGEKRGGLSDEAALAIKEKVLGVPRERLKLIK